MHQGIFCFHVHVHQGILHTHVHQGMGTSQLPKEGFSMHMCTRGLDKHVHWQTGTSQLHSQGILPLHVHQGILHAPRFCTDVCTKSWGMS